MAKEQFQLPFLNSLQSQSLRSHTHSWPWDKRQCFLALRCCLIMYFRQFSSAEASSWSTPQHPSCSTTPLSSRAGWLLAEQLQPREPRLRGALRHSPAGMRDAAQLWGSVKRASKAWITHSPCKLHTRDTAQPCFFSFNHCIHSLLFGAIDLTRTMWHTLPWGNSCCWADGVLGRKGKGREDSL